MSDRVFTQQIMGLPFSIHLRADEQRGPAMNKLVELAAQRVWQDLRAADQRFSPYLPSSEVSRINAGEQPSTPQMLAMLDLAERARLRTRGVFDVHYPGTYLEPCGLVKGWAAANAAAHLSALGADFYLNAGGDLMASAPSGMLWRLGIEHPRDPGGLLGVVSGTEFALATSGTAHRGNHIFDVISRRPAAGLLQVSVIGPELVWADVLATAFVAAGHIDRSILDDFPEYGVLSYAADDRVLATPVMRDHLAVMATD